MRLGCDSRVCASSYRLRHRGLPGSATLNRKCQTTGRPFMGLFGSLKDLQLLSMIDQFAMNLRQKDPEKFLGTTLFELTARSNVISLCIMDRFRDICTISGSDFLTIQGQAHGPEELALGFYQSVAAQMQRQSRTSLASAEKIMELFVSHNGDLFADNIDSTEMELLDRGMKWQKLDAIRSSLPL